MLVYLDKDIADSYFTEGKRIAVALSGGADSVFLLDLLCKAAKEKKFSLYAIHINHMIRGKEADRDENFCRELCKKLGVRFLCERRNVLSEAEISGKTLEEAARDARYSSFEKLMESEEIPVIATAHNADDLAENILIRLIRGTSLEGICGIPSERELGYGKVVRPILSVSKKEITEYCSKNGLQYVTDSTNLCDDYTRNKIRNRIIPMIEEINPAFLSVSARNAELFSRDSDLIEGEAERLYRESLSDRGVIISNVRKKHKALLSRVINKHCIICGARPEQKHIEALVSAIESGVDTSLSLPGKKRATLDGDVFYVKNDTRIKDAAPSYRFKLSEGENHFEIPESGVYVTAVLRKIEGGEELIFAEEKYSLKPSIIYNLSTHRVLNFDTINGELFLRNRVGGDRIDFGTFKKSLKKLMSEKGIPQNIRDILPCLEADGEIIYVPFAAEALRCNPHSGNGKGQKLYSLELRLNFILTED